ncbi:tyrosine--tRNA ligase [Candidatus Blochmannia ocreatus (nom. nud.)]|uniref:Tyrosine--tRNA ligase n=1 Tax=Candidatus Blochmannia ocreatus (nom. nud.) TaxID=251538 RepID=A0ABY4SU25_9ENTR|nr:tyrosine--tRNA ligase [Candidatus Blochmannia ocreatus]URJ24879.1 tyrosine--tRNA ligase [Candidatus Blochmannia ocreatus]
MKYTNIIQYLYTRNSIAQITNKEKLINITQSQSITLYCGFDPTSDSLHIGHLILLINLRRFQLFGHHPVILIGGATGLIGDPSFKNSARKICAINTVQKWVEKIKHQVSKFINCSNNHASQAHIVNNYNWLSSISLLKFLREIGNFFSINKMINKDSIKKRLQKNNHGISYAEFSYNLLQSYDFSYLYQNYNTILQIGGSDQWGNIISGIELIHRIHKHNTYGITMPLLTTKYNTKFGKTEKNTIWLDPKKTSPYKFYQYWLNISDKKVYNFLKIFTNMPIEQIEDLKKEDKKNHKKPKAQTILAKKITQLVHGRYGLKNAQNITNCLFTGKIHTLTLKDFKQLSQDGIPFLSLKFNTTLTLQQVLVESTLAFSKTQAKTLILSKSIRINSMKQTKINYIFCATDKLYNRYTILQRGKKSFCLITWE